MLIMGHNFVDETNLRYMHNTHYYGLAKAKSSKKIREYCCAMLTPIFHQFIQHNSVHLNHVKYKHENCGWRTDAKATLRDRNKYMNMC